MAYNLDSGFLVLYPQWDMWKLLSNEQIGIMLRASIERQTEGKPFPNTDDALLKMAMLASEGIIQNRLQGSQGGRKASKKHTPSHTPYDTKVKLSKVKLSKDNISPPIIPPIEKNANECERDGEGENESLFEEFWNMYPKKLHRSEAFLMWNSLSIDMELAKWIYAAIEAAKASESWQTNGGKYIPLPENWLKAKKWELYPKPYKQTQLYGTYL